MTVAALQAWMVVLALASQPAVEAAPAVDDPPSTRWSVGRLRLAMGSELDTNARRAIQGAAVEGDAVAFPNASRPFEVVSDGLLRVVLDSAAGLRFGDHSELRGHYVLGAKRFFQETTEDLLVQEIGLASQHRLADPLQFIVDGTYKGSRIRSGLRDYDVLTAGLELVLRLGGGWLLDVQGRLTRFEFATEPRFDFWGPRGSAALTYRPHRRFTIAARGGVTRRLYDGRALVERIYVGDPGQSQLEDTGGLTFCENPAAELMNGYQCTPAGERRDLEVTASLSLSYRGPFLISAQYLMRLQRSNSDFENIDRHRFELTATFVMPGRVTVNVLGALQFNQGVSITDQKFLADADENQNSVNIGLQRPLTDTVYLEGRYALFANQFNEADVTFFRHTGYIGLGYRGDFVGVSR